MLIPKKNRIVIYECLFKHGVIVAKKDFNLMKHPELETVPNLQVIKALQSLKSRGYVKENFCWRHYYWFLKNEGIEYLREYLHLPPEIVPATLRRQPKADTTRARPRATEPRSPGGREADRDQYRRGGPMEGKPAGPGGDFNPEFRGGANAGIGRGRGFGAPPS
eukprot:Seg2177.2 transcript_id=Seg2177.2/GoldUCD/mRNA.D3Y31 product="40S ribosomal protein S10" pseudo=true protein_id=Seg2177.2/GoldUCD/D3Y31